MPIVKDSDSLIKSNVNDISVFELTDLHDISIAALQRSYTVVRIQAGRNYNLLRVVLLK
jgi:hypothetical protein